VAEGTWAATLRVVQAPPAWMGPAFHAAEAAPEEVKVAALATLQNYSKLVEDGRRPGGRGVCGGGGALSGVPRCAGGKRGEYFRGRFKSGMQDGGMKEVTYEDVSPPSLHPSARPPPPCWQP